MAYGHIMGFMYDVGEAVGEFMPEGEVIVPDTLEEIVHTYVNDYYWLDVFLLRRQIINYLAKYAVDGKVDHRDPPFNQELCFVEYYFQCELFPFLHQVLTLLDAEIPKKRARFVDVIIGNAFSFFIRK
ncbi:hypothetical protein BWR59_11260 [Pseudomonas sp. Bc-h]|jgi:hypothetical protein|uniref:hypothetical protein n=1 Tax=Pseudomonas sp. Bc-h TaxID=1943632 RepID=UPI0009DA50CE|nr:hypothetical protein [Pseudomonas sp. Bc-h]OQR32539.1 hypothetical protein BWR59_11260 [Pseudomonas sp. Bc-h]